MKLHPTICERPGIRDPPHPLLLPHLIVSTHVVCTAILSQCPTTYRDQKRSPARILEVRALVLLWPNPSLHSARSFAALGEKIELVVFPLSGQVIFSIPHACYSTPAVFSEQCTSRITHLLGLTLQLLQHYDLLSWSLH